MQFALYEPFILVRNSANGIAGLDVGGPKKSSESGAGGGLGYGHDIAGFGFHIFCSLQFILVKVLVIQV